MFLNKAKQLLTICQLFDRCLDVTNYYQRPIRLPGIRLIAIDSQDLKGCLFVMNQALLKVWTRHFSSPPLLYFFFRSAPILFFLCAATTAAAGVIDVTRWGARPNDSGDDSSAIQMAIDAAPNGSTIYFPKGTYLLSNVTIDHRSGLTLSGDGPKLTILKHHGPYFPIFISTGSTDMLITKLGFDTNGVPAFGGFAFFNAKRVTITKTHFFDSNKPPVAGYDRYSWVFGRSHAPSEDILISDNLIEDLQLEVDFGLRVRIEGNTIVRPVATAGIGVFTITDNTTAQEYTIQNNTIVDPVVSAGGIVVHLDPPTNSYSTMKTFRILDNRIVYTKYISGNHASAIRIGTGDSSKVTQENVFDDIAIRNNVVYKDPGSPYDFGNVEAIIFGNSSAAVNLTFNNIDVTNNRIYYNGGWGLHIVDIREKGVNYVETNNLAYAISSDIMPPSVPTALTTTNVSDNQIDLAWNASIDNIGVSEYRIYRNGLILGRSTGTSYSDHNLKPGTSYIYTITATDLNGNESEQSYSVPAAPSAQITVPSAPSQLSIASQ